MLAKDYYQAGQLGAAIAAITAEVKTHPADLQRRGFLAELLCFDGNVERADLQIDIMAKQDTALAVGIALFRQVLRGEQARQQLFGEGRLPELLGVPPAHLRLSLEAVVALRAGDETAAFDLATAAEEARPPLRGNLDDTAFDTFRDLDDIPAGVFAVITSTGKYYWVPMERVVSWAFRPPQRPRDLIWRGAEMMVEDGPEGEIFLPVLYPIPAGVTPDDQIRLGRASDWVGGDGTPTRGLGQRCFLVGEEAVPILTMTQLTFARNG